MVRKNAARGITPKMAEEEGRRVADTPLGFAVYLTFVAAYGSDPDGAGKGHAHDYLNVNNSIGADSWECDRDELNYICLLGEWFCQEKIDYERGDRTKRFAEMVPTLFVASDPWEARRIVEDTVREEMQQFDVPDQTPRELEYLRFLQECFTCMGHMMTGTLQAPYVQRMLNAWERRASVPACTLHELLRRESVVLWKTFEKQSLGERTIPLYRLVDETIAMATNRSRTENSTAARSADQALRRMR